MEEVTKRTCTVVLSDIMEEELEIIVIRKKVFECFKTFKLKFYLNQHRLVHRGKTEPFICNICGNKYTKRRYLCRHKRRHSEKRHFVCPVCKSSFKIKSEMVFHMGIHKKNRTADFQCEECGKSFLLKKSVKAHQRIHLRPKYKCGICDKEFHRKYACKEHELTHTNDELFKCETCGKKFITYSKMLKHSLLHKKKTFACKQCPKTFTYLIHLERHERLRKHGGDKNDIICKTCNNTFPSQSYLNRHIQRCHEYNTNDTHLPCPLCDKTFLCKRYLRKHQLSVHPVLCHICDRSFCTNDGLSKHISKVHNLNIVSFDHSYLKLSSISQNNFVTNSTDSASTISKTLPNSTASVIFVQSENVIIKSTVCNDKTWKSTAAECVSTNSNASDFSTSRADVTAISTVDSIQSNSVLNIKLCQPKRVIDVLYRCSLCSKLFDDQKTLQKHVEEHSTVVHKVATPATTYCCVECCITFENQFLLDDHNHQFHDKISNPFGCFICKDIFTTMEQLFKHGQEKHQAKYLAPIASA